MSCCTWNLCDGRHSIVHLCSPLAALQASNVSASPYSKPVSCCECSDTHESEEVMMHCHNSLIRCATLLAS